MVKGSTVGAVIGIGVTAGIGYYLFTKVMGEQIPRGFHVEPGTWSQSGFNRFRFYYDGEPLRNVSVFAHSNVFKNLLVRLNNEGYGVVETILVGPPLISTGNISFELPPQVSGLLNSIFTEVKFKPEG